MDRISGDYVDEDLFGPGKHGFRSGDPNAVPPVLPTRVTRGWLNGVQEELCSVVELDGGTLDPDDREQVGRVVAGKARGPDSSDNDRLAVFDGVTGKLLKQNTQRIDGHGLRLASNGVFGFTAARQRTISFHPSQLVPMAGTGTVTIGDVTVGLESDNARALLDLSPHIRPGTSIGQIDVRVAPGAARAATGNRITVGLYFRSTLTTVPSATLVASATDDGTSNPQTITLTGPLTSFADSYVFFLLIEGGDDGGAHVNDAVGGIRMTIGQTEVW